MQYFQAIVPYLNNPLAIVGFVLFLMFGVHRALISSGILPPVSQTDAPQIVRDILRYGFFAAIIVLASGFALAAWNTYIDLRKSTSLTGSLHLVDAKVVEPSQVYARWPGWDENTKAFPKLDVSFRNDGIAIASITRAVITIKHVWIDRSPWLPSYRDISWNYDAILPITGEGCRIVVPLSQDIKSNESDRFTITLGNDAPGTYDWFLFDIETAFFYNEDDSSLSTKEMIYLTPGQHIPVAENENLDRQISSLVYNLGVLAAVEKTGAALSEEAAKWADDKRSAVDRTVDQLVDPKSDLDTHIQIASILGRMGWYAKAALPVLEQVRDDKATDPKLMSAIGAAISSIQSETEPAVDLRVIRDDGHEGCSVAPGWDDKVPVVIANQRNEALAKEALAK
ncbi:hypothetical protein [Mesorhizobium loti]|uniref:hypothetical protein n=1 Tax=Rhizobium loti TaxID=381 RepID=UPI0004B5EB4C|nr:hypothetical protein [Mesorhizobium loti]